MKTGGNLGHYKQLCDFHRVDAGFWCIDVARDGEIQNPDKWPKTKHISAEWRLMHNGGDIYQIEYSPFDNVTHELFRGRISDADFLSKLMHSFQEWDKTRRFYHINQ